MVVIINGTGYASLEDAYKRSLIAENCEILCDGGRVCFEGGGVLCSLPLRGSSSIKEPIKTDLEKFVGYWGALSSEQDVRAFAVSRE